MKRAAVAFAALALAGCGHGDTAKRTAPAKEARHQAGKKLDQAEQALRELRHSDLPKDAQKELEEAKELLDEQR
ncbi:MAG: hypothetical protein QOI80_396 [Solirubrobacteraceae bacterium]|jgi:hypothetical protein|nr:hypothetical protein [Solirubrobacteraceae bacterium]